MEEKTLQTPTPKTPVKQVLAEPPQFICKFCKAPITPEVYFCPTCGKKLNEPPFKFSWTKFIGNMILTILFPPLGIFPGIKHLKNPDQTSKILGILYIVLTIIVTVVMIKITMDFINNINKELNNTYLMQDITNDPQSQSDPLQILNQQIQ